MSAILEIENIGNFRGKKSFNFIKGKVNYLSFPNASGKSSIIKSIAAVLSLPLKKESTIEEAEKIGIKSFKGDNEPLVNIQEKEASIRLSYDGKERSCRIKKEGSIKIQGNLDGEEEFVLAGTLTRESRLFRQLIEGNSDVQWVIDVLSLAENYKKAKEIVQEIRDFHSLEFEMLRKVLEERERIKQNKESLEKDLKKVQKEQEEVIRDLPDVPTNLTDKYTELNNTMEDLGEGLQQLERDKNSLKNEILSFSKYEEELQEIENEISKMDKQTKKLEKEKEKIEDEIKEWPKKVSEIVENNKSVIKKITDRIADLREEKGKKSQSLDLNQSSLKLISGQKVLCPLCKQGKLDKKIVERDIQSVTTEIKKINQKISRLIKEKGKYEKELEQLGRKNKKNEQKRDNIQKEINKLSDKLKDIRGAYREITGKVDTETIKIKKEALNNINNQIKEKSQEKKKIKNEMENLREKIEDISSGKESQKEKLGELKEKLRQFEKEINDYDSEISRLDGIINQKAIDMGVSQVSNLADICDQWIKTLDNTIIELDRLINEQREGVRQEFNKEVESMINKLEFDFDIYIKDNFNIEVKRNNVKQQISFLSESEKAGVSLILQVILNKVYLGTPFLVIDELIMGFDESRKKAVLEYLGNIANEKYVIVAKLPT